jgi:hypothetical protein
MNITIEKLTNGYVVTINGKRTFCDVPEAICGMTSEAVLAECERLDNGVTDVAAEFEKAMHDIERKTQIARSWADEETSKKENWVSGIKRIVKLDTRT